MNLAQSPRWSRRGFAYVGLVCVVAAAALALLLVPAAPALAAEGAAAGSEEHGSPWLDFAYKVVNFAVLVGLIVYFARRPLGAFLSGSAGETLAAFIGSRKAVEEAAAELEEQKKKLAEMENELRRMTEATHADGAAERQQLVEEAEAQAHRIREQGSRQIEQEMAKARAALKMELADEVVRLAEGLIRARVDDAQHTRLVGEFIDRLETAK
ncbi:MAG: ATP synthase F0 subunit B [bacterium]